MSEQDRAFRLDPADRKKIEKLCKQERDARIYSRYLALLWLDDGRSVAEVAALLDRDPSTLRKWLSLFKKKGSQASIISRIVATPGT
jgi:transposase-like protein